MTGSSIPACLMRGAKIMKSFFATAGAVALIASLSACTKKEEAEKKASEDDAMVEFETPSDDESAGDDKLLNDNAPLENALDLIDEDAPEADGTERFFGKKSFTIVSKQTGMEEGDVVEHVRDWGRKRAEIKNTSVSIGGFTQPTSQRAIYDGSKITTVDETTGRVTTTTNPMYDAIVARMKGKSGVDFGKEVMIQMNGEVTDEKGNFDGHDCEYWVIASMGAKSCITSWGGTLHTIVNMGGMSMEKTAIEVRMNDGGPDDAFAYDASKATEAPNLEEIMKKMNPG